MNNSPMQLNQSALQDFQDCQRRFELRFLNDTVWPAAQGQPLSKFESLTELGNNFHHLCYQFFLGIDPALLSSTITDPDLQELWDAFLPYGKSFSSLPHAAEQILRVPFRSHFLVAKYDLVVQQSDNKFLIIDWKTARKKPDRSTLASRVQTYLYPYIFDQAAKELFPVIEDGPLSITMQYYYPLSSDPVEIYTFGEMEKQQTQERLTKLIAEIEDHLTNTTPFPLTEDLDHCTYCSYRSFCERGYDSNLLPLGFELEDEDLSNFHFDLDLIKEIDY